ANASFQVNFNPDLIKPDDILREVQAIEGVAEKSEQGIIKGRDRVALVEHRVEPDALAFRDRQRRDRNWRWLEGFERIL
ncbi:hypothetical protein ACC704_38200, partial [Rhizobium johnstonii]